jgi:acyl dehydratase
MSDANDTDGGDDTDADDSEDRPSVFNDIEAGDTDVTQGRTITESDITNFAGVSGDFNHLHTDDERMSDSMFGERIAHGMLVVSAATGLLWQQRTPEEREAVVAFYGIDELRFRQPVYAGDTIRVETEVLETREQEEGGPGSGTVRSRVEIKNQRNQTVVSCEITSLME